MLFPRNIVKKSLCNYRRWNWIKKYQALSNYSSSSKYDVGSNILGYSVKQVEKIPELNLTAIQLQHKTTGVDHLHLECNDSNNLFCVALKTIPKDSTGVPHILEHLALCGSKKIPCRDPFMNMLNRSLATFLNAFTGSDSTMYVFSTQNAKDFQNLLSVYLDAVFFPNLHEKDFRQEGWRLEHEDIHDTNSPIIFKGVVFNEMKGVFSDPNQYYARHLQNTLLPSNTYSFESGGDPLCIPSLTWENLKKFYSEHYHPSNSRFLTYGNMPLQVHLEQIENSVLKNFKKINIENEIPDESIWDKPKEIRIHNRFDPMAAIPEKQTIISNSYLLERITNTYENFALSILGTLLVDGPNAPFYQKLLESGIGPDFSPCVGYDGSLKQSLFSVGVREVAENDIEVVKNVIEETFDEVIKTGFPEAQIKGVLHNVELATKHRTSNFGLHCAMGVNAMWNHRGNPLIAFRVNDHVKWFMKQMNDNPNFLQDKIVQYFKDNRHRLTLIMSPLERFEDEQQVKEKKLLESKISHLNDIEKLKIYTEGLELAKYQQNNVDVSCLPTLQIEDVNKNVEKTPLSNASIKGVHVQLCEQPTNEVIYFNALVDASSVPEEYTMLLPLFCSIVTEMGAGNRNYKELDQEIKLKTGGFDVSVHVSDHHSVKKEFQKGVLFSSYCLERNISDMFSLWKDIFNQVHLEDHAHLSQLIKLNATDLAQGIPYKGHIYSMRKASSSLSESCSMREKTSGLSQISFMKKLAGMDSHEDILEKLKLLSKFLLQRNLRCAINATPSAMPNAVNNLESFLSDVSTNANLGDGSPKSDDLSKHQKTHFVLPLSVNYLGQSILTVPYCHKDFASLKVMAKLMSSKFLHREIREKGGAYGGGATLSTGGLFMFYSYRDPNVHKTLETFSGSIDWILNEGYSAQEINEAKLGVFGEVDAPVPPGSKGLLYFKEGISDDMKQELRENIFKCSKDDLISACQKYLKKPEQVGTALIGPENQLIKSSTSEWSLLVE